MTRHRWAKRTNLSMYPQFEPAIKAPIVRVLETRKDHIVLDVPTPETRVMCYMYSGLRSRFDTLFTLSCLSMHCQAPKVKNMKDLDHLLRYLNGTTTREMRLEPSNMDTQVYADASFMLHPDRRGHTGCLVTLGPLGPCIGAKSFKQKMIVLSSTEGEVLAAFESLPLLRTAAALNRLSDTMIYPCCIKTTSRQ